MAIIRRSSARRTFQLPDGSHATGLLSQPLGSAATLFHKVRRSASYKEIHHSPSPRSTRITGIFASAACFNTVSQPVSTLGARMMAETFCATNDLSALICCSCLPWPSRLQVHAAILRFHHECYPSPQCARRFQHHLTETHRQARHRCLRKLHRHRSCSHRNRPASSYPQNS